VIGPAASPGELVVRQRVVTADVRLRRPLIEAESALADARHTSITLTVDDIDKLPPFAA